MFFTFEGKKVYYEIHGEGKPLLLLNGIMMSTKSWTPFIETLSYQNKLILVDFLDQGQSEKMPEGGYNHDIQVRLVVALLDELKIDKTVVCGISYGSQVALEFTCRHQDRVERTILFNTSAYTSPWLDDIGKAWNMAADTGNGAAYYYTAIPVIYSPMFYENRLDWMRNREKVLFPVFEDKSFIEAMKRLTVSSSDYDVRPILKNIKTPVLVVSSEEDYLLPMRDQKYIVDHVPTASYVKIPNSGHCSMFEQPAVFTSLIIGFANVKETNFKI